ncbi:class II aldolase/adducin family protein [Kocuria flava]|uniref:class II aldolase/adducin family protein n=1 Tax=Kocuria flava TaxID=446860 RepID=UPI001C5D978E
MEQIMNRQSVSRAYRSSGRKSMKRRDSVGLEDAIPAKDSQLSDLVDANHILFDQGVLDAFGHVSVRADEDSEIFFLSRNLAPVLVSEDDIQIFSLDAETDDLRPPYLERFIHAEIYRSRPDVMSVIHSHSPAVVPFSVSDAPLRPVMHMAGFLPMETPVFEMRQVAGPASDLLVRDRRAGAALAEILGSGSFALMRGHGSVAVGESLKTAVYRAIYAELNARAQADAMRLGSYTCLTRGEGEATVSTMASQIERAWGTWRMQARTRHQGLS